MGEARRQVVAATEAIEEHRQELERMFDAFEALLKRAGVKVTSGSLLESTSLFIRQLRYIRQDGAPLPTYKSAQEEDDVRRRAGWLRLLATKLLDAEQHRNFKALVPHLKLFESGEFAQNIAGPRDESADKLFELVLGLALVHYVDDLQMDDGRSAAANPDLLFRFAGARWAIACKTLNTTDPRRYCDAVAAGAKQIEKADCDRGVVCVNIRNLLNHSLFIPRQGELFVGISREERDEILDAEQQKIFRGLARIMRDVDKDLATRSKKVERGVLHFVGSCYRGGTPHEPRTAPFCRIHMEGNVNGDLFETLNEGLQPDPKRQ